MSSVRDNWSKGTSGAALGVALLFSCGACDDAPLATESSAVVPTPPAALPAQPPRAAASELGELGRLVFFDPSLSGSGRMSCATCHSPSHAYGPPNDLVVQLGGPKLQDAGRRVTPSLRYLRRTPIWSHSFIGNPRERLTETDHVPVGGLTWDGRFDSLAAQAAFPLLAHDEMANGDAATLAARAAQSSWASSLRTHFGEDVFDQPDKTLAALGKVLERFQLDDPSFQPFDSKYDRVLDGKAELTPEEQRGLDLFRDPEGGNCAACHIVSRGANGAHPLFTDFSFAALGVPRNPKIPANADPRYFDLGLCGPVRTDKQQEKKYCGMFKTPSLRNVAIRRAFFHNGRFTSLEEALHFYVERDSQPAKWYPHPGKHQADDLPSDLQGNVDHITPPFTQRPGDAPVWTDTDIRDVVAFLETLTDSDAVRLLKSGASPTN